MRLQKAAWLALAWSLAWAQDAPVIFSRGVTNAFTQQPAPATVGPGGLLQISGISLGPPEGARASGANWPNELGGVQVLVNGSAAPVGAADPGKLIAQVPLDAALGLAEVVVKRGANSSRPARIFIADREPSVRTADGSGFGLAWGDLAGATLMLSASGLGTADPIGPIAAFVGGIRSSVTVSGAAQRPGEFDVQIQAPAGARPGDLISLVVGNRGANRTLFQAMTAADVQFLALPDGAPALRDLVDTDLNGNFLIGTGARDDSGCSPALIFDLLKQTATQPDNCLATVPVAPNEGDMLGALVGPPQGDATTGLSSRVEIFSASRDPLTVDLPSPAIALTGAAGDFTAVLAGTPPQAVAVDGVTGELRPAAGLGAARALGNINVDGLTHPLSAPVNMGQGRFALIVGDDADQPKRAKFAVVNLAGDVQLAKDFPDGWLPLLGAPLPQAPGRGGGGAPGIFIQLRESASFDAVSRIFYALAKSADGSRHSFLAFTLDRTETKTISFPDGWFAAACTPAVRLFTLDLSRRLALIGSNVPDADFKNPCPGTGFVQLDLVTQGVSAIPLPGQALMSAGSAAEVNDYIYATNTDPSRRNTADTLFILDGVSASSFSLALPTGISSFTGLRPIRELSVLAGSATDRAAGDQGLVLFNLDQATASVLPVPDGFASVAELQFFFTTRKLVARGTRAQGRGSQLLIYDLNTGDVTVVPNPDGVASIGPPAQAGGQGGPGGPLPPGGPGGFIGPGAQAAARLLSANAKANTVSAVGYNAEGKQVGIVVVRVP